MLTSKNHLESKKSMKLSKQKLIKKILGPNNNNKRDLSWKVMTHNKVSKTTLKAYIRANLILNSSKIKEKSLKIEAQRTLIKNHFKSKDAANRKSLLSNKRNHGSKQSIPNHISRSLILNSK